MTASLSLNQVASVGDQVYLGTLMANLHFWGIVQDPDSPAMATGSFELNGTDGSVTLDALVGPQGVPGEPSPIVKVQWADDFTDPSQLPANLGNNDIDIGKAWWIGNTVWVWTGTDWYQRQMGTPGPPGPVPHITPSAQLVPSGQPTSLTVPILITPSGTDLNPGWLIQFDQDSITGPPGPSGPIRDAADYDNSVAPVDLNVISWSAARQKFYPAALNMLGIQFYSMPESAFNSFSGPATGPVQIGSFAVPPQPYDWKPIVFGHFYSAGIDTSLTIDSQVLLGDPTAGVLVGKGHGNIGIGWSTIVPHFSSAANTATAITPNNGTALVPANHTGNQGNITVQLNNVGTLGAFVFQPAGAQLLIGAWPVSGGYISAGS